MKIKQIQLPYYTYEDKQPIKWEYITDEEIDNIYNNSLFDELVYNHLIQLFYKEYKQDIDEYICNHYGNYNNFIAEIGAGIDIDDPNHLAEYAADDWIRAEIREYKEQ